MSSNESTSFDILGSSKLNTADGKNPPSSSTSTNPGNQATGQANEAQKKAKSAHDAMEDRLREEERLARWKRE